MSYRSVLIIIFIRLLLPFTVSAAPTVNIGPAPAWVVKMSANDRQPDQREITDGYFLQLYEREINTEREEVYQHVIRHIVSDAGVQEASNISISFNPAYEQLTVHQVTVWRDGKPLNKMEKDGFKVMADEPELSKFIYDGNYSAFYIVKDIRKNDKIEYAYTIRGRNPVFERKFYKSVYLQGTDPMAEIHFTILSPVSDSFTFKYFNNAEKPVVTHTGSTVLYDWDLQDVKGRENAKNAPEWFTSFPHVQISQYSSWSEVAEWALRINKPEDKLQGELAKRVAKLKEKFNNDSAGLLRALADIVQNEIRYMGVEMGAYSHKANSPEKVYDQRYGDCKDKSLLLVSMLHSAGLRAEMALVNSEREKIEDDLPSPFSFNHAIVVAHFGDKDVWIDPTIPNQGGTGINIYFPDYGKALVLAQGTTTLTSIPESQAGGISYIEEYDVSDPQKPAMLTVHTTYTLNKADDLRSYFANQSKSDLEKSYLDYYSKTYPHIESADTVTIKDDKQNNTFETIERYKIDDFLEFDSANRYYEASFYAAMIRNQLPVVGNKKDYPIAVEFPYNIHYAIHVNAPIRWRIDHKNEQILRNAYRFTYDVSAAGDQLSVEYDFKYLKDNIAAGEIGEYEKDRKKIVNDYLSYSFTYSTPATNIHKGPDYWAILVVTLLLGASVYAGLRIYKTKTNQYIFLRQKPKELGGWLILPIIGLVLSAGKIAYSLISTGYFLSSTWHVYDTQTEHIPFTILLWMELTGNSIMVFLSLFCLLLIFKKRDILPLYMKILYISSLVLVTMDGVFAHALFPSTAMDFKEISRAFIAACIWVPYFSRSVRVKETFIVPYQDADYLPKPIKNEDVYTSVASNDASSEDTNH
jgi:transglutaminase-like putative cysteine protease